ncbi:hypothetical protein PACTADRAFT_926 [Pachysolen tannophilus NRRL Y-2460]|uniref:Processing of GAS1 and ALP protein 2 n=1 Tax=Pachysolen tannophilus NRRL Y-2460 TaxID=669874 RepID=A0A1E4U387_PACTA|nr:hypothetical protein PACTADRAFT_926 [Pachysolen tannophilus NRRL Y-2460]
MSLDIVEGQDLRSVFHDLVPDVLPDFLKNFSHDLIDELEPLRIIRLIAIVGGYIFARRIYMKYAQQKQLEEQLARDEKLKTENLINGSDLQSELIEDTDPTKDDQSWGWGKTTRRKVKQQQKIFEDELIKIAEEKAALDDSEDELTELLED